MLDQLIVLGAKYLIWVVCLIALWFMIKRSEEERKKVIILAIITLPISYVVAKILGHFYYDPRPFVENNFVPLIPHAMDNGFPSDHTLFASAIASVIYASNKKWGTGLFILALLVGISRVLAGVHHGVDIIGSLIITIAITVVVYRIVEKYSKKQQTKF